MSSKSPSCLPTALCCCVMRNLLPCCPVLPHPSPPLILLLYSAVNLLVPAALCSCLFPSACLPILHYCLSPSAAPCFCHCSSQHVVALCFCHCSSQHVVALCFCHCSSQHVAALCFCHCSSQHVAALCFCHCSSQHVAALCVVLPPCLEWPVHAHGRPSLSDNGATAAGAQTGKSAGAGAIQDCRPEAAVQKNLWESKGSAEQWSSSDTSISTGSSTCGAGAAPQSGACEDASNCGEPCAPPRRLVRIHFWEHTPVVDGGAARQAMEVLFVGDGPETTHPTDLKGSLGPGTCSVELVGCSSIQHGGAASVQ